jgi:polyhydroxyalkanoate synthesis regulator phasin
MPTKTQQKSSAKSQQKDIFAQVRDLGSEAFNRLSEIPGGSRLAEMANETKARLDEMQKKLRGLDALERRVAKLEQQLAALNASKATTARKPSTARKSTTSSGRASTARKPPA